MLALSASLAFAIGGIVIALQSQRSVAWRRSLPSTCVCPRRIPHNCAGTNALPFYIDAVRQLMSVGNSLPQALMRAMPNAAEPSPDLPRADSAPYRLGRPRRRKHPAACRSARRFPKSGHACGRLRTNLRFGGSMATILNNLSHIMRERIRINRELSACNCRGQDQHAGSHRDTARAYSSAVQQRARSTEPSSCPIRVVITWHSYAAILQGIGMIIMMRIKRLSF
jgi:Flp pilus assembly protein TadB